LATRAKQVDAPPDGWHEATGPGVTGVVLPCGSGRWGWVTQAWRYGGILRAALERVDALQLQLPSAVGTLIWRRAQGRPYGVEVIGDPLDAYAPGASTHPLRPLLRWYGTRTLKVQCSGACAVAYVTREMLQRRYPADPEAFTTYYSGIVLRDEELVDEPRLIEAPLDRPVKIATLANLSNPHKGIDVLIEAAGLCIEQDLSVELAIAGDGDYRGALESQATEAGLTDQVQFRGYLSDAGEVRSLLDTADIFALPSRAEGLPKAIIEAMARALPCVSTTVGGIPELLPPEALVPPGDAEALAERLVAIARDPEGMNRMSARNLAEARTYLEQNLRPRRIAFYRHVRDRVRDWVADRA
jgi:glycosyltransferase involved in cell wall biosynthesis